ncbi:adenine-specific DNA-methyltransferase [Fibrobacter sp. UWH5]|uniref:site-specific DNA-methyltransferase n=1 Tax=Fibrobacter sp. UWH5 TaxID=1896211 RepID=UPI0009197E14|nr:site-specific DNA-methyltransferase [Fibrobacter sp. UWH5]SHL46271.1 adenine-specific DNA-methyltransferase [Fibrobacter sp. UWH5]
MEKMKFETPDMTQMNIEKIAALFPNCITEKKDANGKITKAVNFDALKQILGDAIADGDESYEFTWVGKRDAMVEAAKPIRKTLRPCVEESVNFDTTENLYIEGDNLEALKLLQEGYLGKVKMIYIDPPYNTGNDFIYKDDFRMDSKKYDEESGAIDDEGNRMVQNSDSNGRFHSDWCSMIYSRLLLARNLLTDDGVIFISIDDNEQGNLKSLCDEVFGSANFISNFIWKSRQNKDNRNINGVSIDHEYVLVYGKRDDIRLFKGEERSGKGYSNPDNDPLGPWASANMAGIATESQRPNLHYDLINPATGINYGRPKMGWRYDRNTMSRLITEGRIIWPSDPTGRPRKKTYLNELDDNLPGFTSMVGQDIYTRNGSIEIDSLFGERLFSFPKPSQLIQPFVSQVTDVNSIVLDFFSGSATTAHAVMQLNAEDGGHRKFILVQLPEKCDESSEAAKAGYKNICEIGKERIRRAGAKILAEKQAEQQKSSEKNDLFDAQNASDNTAKTLDIGFRVLKIDDSNMKDVYYSAGEVSQQNLLDQISNIKENRTDMDLLFGCLVDWGVSLSLPIKTETIEGVTIHNVNDGDLIASFSENIPETVIRQIAAKKPLRVVFRDFSFRDAPSKINVTEIFKTLSPNTTVKVI